MKSILWQLTKYQKDSQNSINKQIIIDTNEPHLKYSTELLKILTDNQYEYRYKELLPLLNNITPSVYEDVLFPRSVCIIYHYYYRHQIQISDEKYIDDLFSKFLASQDKTILRQKFLEISDDAVYKIIMARALIAALSNHGSTFANTTVPPIDSLPYHYKDQIAAYLHISPSLPSVMDLLDELHRCCPIESIILGRTGYIILWHWIQQGNKLKISGFLEH